MLFVYVNKDILGVLKENISVKHLKYNKAAQKCINVYTWVICHLSGYRSKIYSFCRCRCKRWYTVVQRPLTTNHLLNSEHRSCKYERRTQSVSREHSAVTQKCNQMTCSHKERKISTPYLLCTLKKLCLLAPPTAWRIRLLTLWADFEATKMKKEKFEQKTSQTIQSVGWFSSGATLKCIILTGSVLCSKAVVSLCWWTVFLN